MDSGELTVSIFTAIVFGNLITAKIVGLSWLTWSDTAIVLIAYMAFMKLLAIIGEANNKNKED